MEYCKLALALPLGRRGIYASHPVPHNRPWNGKGGGLFRLPVWDSEASSS